MTETFVDRGLRINFAPSEAEEFSQNVRTILGITRGEVALYREFGIDAGIIDAPDTVAEARFTGAAFEAIALFEPRVEPTNLDFEGETTANERINGTYRPKLTFVKAETEEFL